MTPIEGKTDCPHCGRENDQHSGINTDEQPDEGSVSLCWGCREPSLFTGDGSLRKPTEQERTELLAEPEIKTIRYAMLEAQRPTEAKEMFQKMNPSE